MDFYKKEKNYFIPDLNLSPQNSNICSLVKLRLEQVKTHYFPVPVIMYDISTCSI